MAIMIPDACPAKASAGEKRLFRLFQDILPDNFKVWYEPIVRGRYPDFILLADTFGLLVIEVKGWYPKDIARATDTEIELNVNENGQEYIKKVPHPIRQVRDYLFPLIDLLAEQALLRQPDGEHQGKLCFPCGYGVLLTNISRPQLDEAGLGEIFPTERTLCRDELTALEINRNDRETIQRLKRLFPADFPFDPLTQDQLKTVEGVIHREVVVKTRAATESSLPAGQVVPPGATVLQVLDQQQEQIAKSMGTGHRVFFGVAGSGKTVLLLARAKLLAGQEPDKRFLVLCYNRVLGTSLRAAFTGDATQRNVQVFSFHAWASERTNLRRLPQEPMEDYSRRLVATLLHTSQTWPDSMKYDGIFIDEGHDFEQDWFRCCVQALRGGDEGDLVIAVDGAQSLYGRARDFTWKSVGVNAVGRSKHLASNYRNTREILEFAWEVTQSTVPDNESETHIRIRPAETARQGLPPAHAACSTAGEEQALIAGMVRRFKSAGIADRDICILYARKQGTRIEDLVKFLKNTEDVCWITDPNNTLARDRFMSMPGVRLSTIHSAKGLEFSAVILCGLDQLPSPMEPEEVRDCNLLYVGLTRATDRLVVTWVGRSAFTERVERSSWARAWQNS